ncbi:sprT-like family domain-containing protein [Ditylenchus destructor]|uniref:SprT-like family domain-containing protein n=1 Tax=Ditylenchus destructor TaxID=166010 RepID=A0AAD4NJT6_9BILA|nr:sprT-like family domain-containing protein [Ditylenchus destructor]
MASSNDPRMLNLVDPSYELLDPTPDIRAQFVLFNEQFFYGALGACTVEWSKKMTSCAGVCHFSTRTGLCAIRLSEPLLKLRPRSDLIETLLHEMIHAFLFVTAVDKRLWQDRDGHGPEFVAHMNRINTIAGTNITVCHSFHAEVAVYKQHWWRCTGPCKDRAPFYGWVKRAMNRAPGKSDSWWTQHQATCSGNFVKVKEPENFSTKAKQKSKGVVDAETLKTTPKINSIFPGIGHALDDVTNTPSTSRKIITDSKTNANPKLHKTNALFPGLGHRLDAAEDGIQKPLIKKTSPFGSKKMKTTVNTPKRRNVIPKLATPRIDSIFRDAGENNWLICYWAIQVETSFSPYQQIASSELNRLGPAMIGLIWLSLFGRMKREGRDERQTERAPHTSYK